MIRPCPNWAAFPRNIFGTFDGYKRALEIAELPQHWSLSLLRDLDGRRRGNWQKRI